jgi:sugar phosphate isomerase/epimerase
MDRKKFICYSSLSLLAVPLSRSAIHLAGEKKVREIKISTNVWVYASTLPKYDVSPVLNQIFSDAAYAGLDGVETMADPLRSYEYTKQIGELKEKYKVALTGTSYGADMWNQEKHNQIFEDCELVMGNLASLGGRTFGASVGKPGGRIKTENEFDAQAELLKKVISMGKGKGITLNLHNHTYEAENNLFDLRNTLKRLPGTELGPDLNWLLRAGIDSISFLREFKNQIHFLHLRDQLSNGKWPEAIGEGNVDFSEIGRVLKEIDFMGDAVIELAFENNYKPTRPLRESLKMSRDYLKKTMGI